jgi:cell migration-inducing and hyaluronan-binding protein
MGQGGRIMHYPVHFHMVRKTPANTIVEDCSVAESMTRWYVIHGTEGITLARNVGYESIGHGYYLEDGTETDNQLFANLGVFSRAAVHDGNNTRQVPRILAAPYPAWNDNLESQEHVPFHSDIDHPTLFWMMNGWNDFQYNMAVGVGSCGACYWLVTGANSTMSRNEKWSGYGAEQSNVDRAGMTPLK